MYMQFKMVIVRMAGSNTLIACMCATGTNCHMGVASRPEKHAIACEVGLHDAVACADAVSSKAGRQRAIVLHCPRMII